MQTVYIAGKITGLRDYEDKFEDAVRKLWEIGYTRILNPCCLPPNLEYEQYMTICFTMIDVADEVWFLDNWQESEGARREHDYALEKNKVIRYFEG